DTTIETPRLVPALLFRRDGLGSRRRPVGQGLGQRLALGIEQSRGAGARNRVGGTARRDVTGERRADDVTLDQAIVAAAARVGVAVALDQARARGNLQRQFGRLRRGLGDQTEPGLDLALFFLETPC